MTGTRRGLAAGILTGALAIWAGTGCGGSDGPPGAAGRGDTYRAQAEALESEGDTIGALRVYRDAARRYPTQAWPWSGTGRTARALGRFSEAYEALATAVRWDSTGVDARMAIAEIALEEGRTDEALAHVDAAIRFGGGSAERLALRGRILAEGGRLAEAKRTVGRALAITPDDPDARIARSECLVRADSQAVALAELNGLVSAAPDEPAALAARGRLRHALGDAEGAVADLQRALELAPARPRDRLALAEWTFAAGDPETAARHFRALLRDNPRHPAALEGVGSCALASGEPDEAEHAFEEAIRSDPEFAPAYLALGRFRMEQGRLDEAVALFRKARARASLDPPLWAKCSAALAEAYLALGEPQHAEDIAADVLTRVPDSDAARALRGRALAAGAAGSGSGDALEQIANRPEATREEQLAYSGWLLEHGDAERALRFAERVLTARPSDPEARVARAGALAALGRSDEAETELHDVLASGFQSPGAHLALARLYLQTERIPDAVFHARQGEELDPDDPDFAVIQGLAALQAGNVEAARTAFERERDLRPESAKAWMNLGRLEMDERNWEDAAACFTKAATLDAAGWSASYHLGLALTEAGRPRDAVDAYRNVLARNDRVAEAHNNLAWLLADLDIDPVLAEVHARRASELAPGNASVLGTLGWAQYKNRLLDEAAVSLKEAKRLAPDDAMKHYMLGVVQLDRGLTESARFEIGEALRLDPAFGRSESARRLMARLEE